CDLLLTRPWRGFSTGFLVSAVKFRSARLSTLDTLRHRLPLFQSTPKTADTSCFGTKYSFLIVKE
ncbi:hypothetical protein pdam_00010147, partial [Pocillopora damicornis]